MRGPSQDLGQASLWGLHLGAHKDGGEWVGPPERPVKDMTQSLDMTSPYLHAPGWPRSWAGGCGAESLVTQILAKQLGMHLGAGGGGQ